METKSGPRFRVQPPPARIFSAPRLVDVISTIGRTSQTIWSLYQQDKLNDEMLLCLALRSMNISEDLFDTQSDNSSIKDQDRFRKAVEQMSSILDESLVFCDIYSRESPLERIFKADSDQPAFKRLLQQLTVACDDLNKSMTVHRFTSVVDGGDADSTLQWSLRNSVRFLQLLQQFYHQDFTAQKQQFLRANGRSESALSDALRKLSAVETRLQLRPNPKLREAWEISPEEVSYSESNLIGSGSFGEVYEGRWMGMRVAIKKPRVLGADIESAVRNEVALMLRVPHGNIIRCYGACIQAPNVFLVLEFAERGNLSDLLSSRKGRLSLVEKARMSVEMVKGMEFLVRSKILHRDLKGQNVLISKHGTCKISDFGLARTRETVSTSLQGKRPAEGTSAYMAPEILGTRPIYSEKSDVYACGMLLWELLAEEPPWLGLEHIQIAIGVKEGDRPDIQNNWPKGLTNIIRKCWAQDSKNRPTFKEVLSELHAFEARVVLPILDERSLMDSIEQLG
eukprot:CAMPEP_0184360246 /NCGR_PEP_ID=MMETSP1089-20130417/124110_1 /TAXON_ID=38269 ORGANISM="Gloeochaete wittrockiana, Strain SAG46.84" /NCGR_SAMPLE_ID=MMETSP1089 /ASSEMBLY_ACC=CAM_ASM_000445 /LENGTH=509 /DNA_ID=CAMNT_0026699367 /DNA_START=135 /DNA_END=1661 /DNA_ORIENTATION=-